MIEWSVKRRDGGEWRLLRRDEIAGRTVREALIAMTGSDTVAEVKLPVTGMTCYFCGTGKLAEGMKSRGKKAVTCEAGIMLIDSAYPGMMDNAENRYRGPVGDQQLKLET